MQLGRPIRQRFADLVGFLRRSPVVLVVSLMAVAAVGAAAVGPGSGTEAAPDPGSEASEGIAARSGPSPGPSIVVQSDPGADRDADAEPRDEPRDEMPDETASPFATLRDGPATVFATDFTDLNGDWEIYYSAGHAGLGLRRPSAISLAPDPEAEGSAVLAITARMGTEGEEAGQLVSGGMALLRPRTYGTYTFRMRVDADPAQVTSGVAILWPASNQWPEGGELDMVETWSNRSTRTPVETNIHYLDPLAEQPVDQSDDRLLSVVHSGLDGTQWHTYRFEWRVDGLSMAIDDGPVRLLTDDPVHIPHWPMVLTFQLDAFPAPGGSREDAAVDGPVTLEVDWLVVEE